MAGLGPAGRALTHRLLAAGLSVLALDPAPDRPWRQTLGGWTGQLPSWLPGQVVGAGADDPVIRAASSYPIRARYAVLDNPALARALSLDGADVHERPVTDSELADLPARVVVDARGSRPSSAGRVRLPLQRAIGVLVEPQVAAPVLDGAQAVLMDWRPFDGSPTWGETPPTFLYAIPMPDGRVLLEETCLAGDPGPDHPELRRRLLHRLARHGLPRGVVEGAEVEKVRLPMLAHPRERSRVLRFGAAGAQHNPITGYSVFASLGAVDQVVAAVQSAVRTDGRVRVADRPPLLRQAALRALLRLGPDDTMALFDAFGRLPVSRQRAVLDARTADLALTAALTSQFARMPKRSALALIRATTI